MSLPVFTRGAHRVVGEEETDPKVNSNAGKTGTSDNAIKKDPVNRPYYLQRGQSPRYVLRPIHL